MNFIKKYIYAFWLGGSLAFSDITVSNYKFWIIIVPTICFIEFFNKVNIK